MLVYVVTSLPDLIPFDCSLWTYMTSMVYLQKNGQKYCSDWCNPLTM